MQRISRYCLISALFMIWQFFTGCYSYLSTPEPSIHQGMDPHFFETLIENGQNNLGTDFNYKLAEDSELSVIGLHSTDVNTITAARETALNAPLLLRFVWLSDVHMRQREIKLGSDWFASFLDEFCRSTEFNKSQEDFQWAVYLSQIAAINKLNRETPLDFMIHTGDSVDTGSIEELYQFIYVSNQLDIPWLNIIGNHDITVQGNFVSRLGYGRDPYVIFYPIGGAGDFIWMHRSNDGQQETAGYGRYLLPVPKNSKHDPSIRNDPNKKLAPTTHHGFDLGFEETICMDKDCIKKCFKQTPPNINALNQCYLYNKYDRAGNYATDLRGIPVRLIALNSSKKDGYWANGSFDDEQRVWMIKKLKSNSNDINLVFFHHRLVNEFELSEMKTLLANYGDGILVAFTGHEHSYSITWHSGQNGRGFYELNTGSVLEFPQIGRVIELRGTPGGRVWLISRALWNSLMTPVRRQDANWQNINNELGRKILLDNCTDKRVAIQKNIAEAVRCGHYGAYDDYMADSNRWAIWARPKPLDEIWPEVNVIIEITQQNGNKQ